MFAVVETGGKQYTVKVGDVIDIEKLEAKAGDKIELKVLCVSDDKATVCGNPIAGAKVIGEVIGLYKAPKVIVYKYKAKKNVRKKQGHRQPYTKVKIASIS